VQSERDLVYRAKQGDNEAFAQLYENNFEKIYRYIILKISNRAEAEDMTQQVFLNSLRSIRSFKWKGISFSAWLFRIAHNLVVDYYRKGSRVKTSPLNDSLSSDSGNPEQITERKVNIEQLLSAAKELTKAQHEVISLRFAAELPIAEVAKIMGKSEGAIKALQHSAILSLRNKLSVA